MLVWHPSDSESPGHSLALTNVPAFVVWRVISSIGVLIWTLRYQDQCSTLSSVSAFVEWGVCIWTFRHRDQWTAAGAVQSTHFILHTLPDDCPELSNHMEDEPIQQTRRGQSHDTPYTSAQLEVQTGCSGTFAYHCGNHSQITGSKLLLHA